MGDGEMGGGGAMDLSDKKEKKDKKDRGDKRDGPGSRDVKSKGDKGKGDESWKEPIRRGLEGIDTALAPVGPQLRETEKITGAVRKGMEKVSERVGVTGLAQDVMKKAREVVVGKAVELSGDGDKKKPASGEKKKETRESKKETDKGKKKARKRR